MKFIMFHEVGLYSEFSAVVEYCCLKIRYFHRNNGKSKTEENRPSTDKNHYEARRPFSTNVKCQIFEFFEECMPMACYVGL